ncbi:P-loop containing nucleoside triphosphate hydrolase protein [Bisporella sp. PMI_857]|nr:P-loop containing nucleoside triphosphate hydrolase protein [Bisporella sp. PMI_857]
MNRTDFTPCLEDYSFGPQTSPSCRDGLDLTLVFEESILALLPGSLMIIASIARFLSLAKASKVVLNNSFYRTKSQHLAVLLALRFILLLLWSIRPPIKTQVSIAAASISMIEAIAIVVLSRSEHVRSIRPSSLLNLYLLFSLGLDFVRMRTLVKLKFDTLIAALSAADMAIKGSLLLLEAQSKKHYLSALDSNRPPQEISGIFNRSTFWWLNSLFLQGYRKVLTLNDLFHMDSELSSDTTLTRFKRTWTMSNASSHRLGKTTVICLQRLFLAPVIPNILVMLLTFTQPFLVTALLNFISSDDNKELGYLIVAGYAVVYVGRSVCNAFYTHQLDRFMTMLRGCLVSIIYDQSLRLDLKAAASGESLTLMSADVEHIVRGFGLVHEAASNAVMATIALGLLYRQLGLAFLAPLIFSLTLSSFNGIASTPYMRAQSLWLEATEKRVGFTASVISAMKGVKILGLVENVTSKIARLRHDEVQRAKTSRIFIAVFTVLQTLSLSGTRWVTYTCFGIVTLLRSSTSGGLNITILFTSLAILNIFMERLEILLRQMPRIASAFACIHRVETFLLAETKRDNRLVGNVGSIASESTNDYELQNLVSYDIVINMKDLSIGWTSEQVILQGVSLEIPRGSFTTIIGPVGSGKSTLIQALLGETITHKGFMSVVSPNSMAFCAQTPWLINKSIQQNILGTSPFDGAWYGEVVRACALVEDLSGYASGDRTLVGSKGMTLSGGQKQRIALARAVYSRKPIVLLDDIFSGLDPVTEAIIFQSLLGSNGILRRESQTVILVTHAVHLLPSADMVVLLGGDRDVLYQGSYSGFPTELISMRDIATSSGHGPSEKVNPKHQSKDFVPTFYPPLTDVDLVAPDSTRQTGDSKIYKYYLRTMSLKHTLLFAFLGAICMGFTPAQSLWLNAWANDSDKGKIRYYLGIYSVFFIGEISLTALWIWHVVIYPLSESSIKLHNIQLSTLMRATMTFFSNTDTGLITNRFSQDLMLVDNELPFALIDLVEYIYNCLYKLVLIAIVSAYILPVFPFMLAAFWMIQKFYLRTSRQIRFLDLETKSPLYTHFIESLAGLATIRGFGWEEEFARQNHVLLDASQRPFFLLATIQRWLTMVLELVVAVLAVILAIMAVEMRGSINPGLLGLALVNVMALSLALNHLVMFWTLLETSIGSISRIKSFSQDTPFEDSTNPGKAPENWLHSGRINILNLSASHSPGSNAVLRDISISIAAGEHIGICGRSGSGKSSLLSVLLRLMEVTSGQVLIDGLDISSIPVNQVRASLNALSQESFFLHGSIRDNLATAASTSEADAPLEAVLTKVGLWNKILALGGLDTVFDADSSFSHGERQLFCLARAMLNPSKVLILDEFTSNVDIKTDRTMQKIIREMFKDRTIIAVAHRLETIMDFDRIVVLDQGVMVEQGRPGELLGRNGAFKRLYDGYTREIGDGV